MTIVVGFNAKEDDALGEARRRGVGMVRVLILQKPFSKLATSQYDAGATG